MRGVDKAERDVPLKLLQEKKKKEKMRKNMEKSFRNSKKKKKKGICSRGYNKNYQNW